MIKELGRKGLFEHLSLQLGHKEKITVFGPNGCGKTTLLKTLTGLCPIEQGEIEIFHKKMRRKKDFKEALREIGFLFQNPEDGFIAPTVLEDVAFGPLCQGVTKEEARERAEGVLRRLDILHLKEKAPFGLSGGEKKLAALAGALVNEPRLLLLDEPTNDLDIFARERIIEILRGLDISIITVSHEIDFAKKISSRHYHLRPCGLEDMDID